MSSPLDVLAASLADRYRLERELGAGGMATVYLAEDLKHGRQVAIKVLHPDLGVALGAERFLAEIRTTAKLQHPHILPLLDSGDAGNGLLYYVMPFVRGETLRARLERERQLPIGDAVRIAREVADALQHAHGEGIVHRDIKPENILLQDGHALVADFGIALAVQSAGGPRLTQTGLSLGTPQYMSPEQAMGERSVDARSDVYALGAVTYEMLAGEPPFTGANLQAIVAKVLTERPVALRTVRDTVPASVESAVMAALAKLPADRPQRAAEFADRLGREGAGAASGGEGDGRAPFPRRRLATIAVVMLAVGAALGAGVASLRHGTPSAGRLGGEAQGNPQLTFDGQSGLPALTPSGDAIAFVRSRCEQESEQGFDLAADATGHSSPCRFTLVVMDSVGTRQVAVLDGAREVTGLRFTSDGTRLVFAGELDSLRRGIFVVPRLGGASRRVAPSGVFDLRRSGDSILAIVGTAGTASRLQARVIDLETGTTTDSIPMPSPEVYALAWSPDGGRIAAAAFGMLYLLKRDGTVTDSLTSIWRGHLRWTPDGTGLLGFVPAPGKEDAFVRVGVDAKGRLTSRPAPLMPRVPTLFRGEFDVAWKTGRIGYVSGEMAQEIWTFPIDSRSPGRRVANSTTFYDVPSLTPDGRALFVMRGDALGDNLYRVRLDTTALAEEPLSAVRGAGIAFSVHVTADGARVYFAQQDTGYMRASYIDLATGQEGVVPLARQYDPRRLAFPLGLSKVAQILGQGEGIRIYEALGAPPRELRTPDSMRVVTLAGDSSGTVLGAIVATGGRLVVGTTPTDRLDFHPRGTLPGNGRQLRLSWGADGALYTAQWVAGAQAPTLFRFPKEGGGGVSTGQVPASCSVYSIVVAFRAPLGACTTSVARGDLRVLRVPELAP